MVDISPIKAEAFSYVTLLSAATVITTIMMGLGVSFQSYEIAEPHIFSALDFLTLNYDYVTDDQKIAVWSTGNPDIPYSVDINLIEAVRDWMWESETVSGIEIPDGFALYGEVYLPAFNSNIESFISSGFDYIVVSGGKTYYYISLFNSAPSIDDDGFLRFSHPYTYRQYRIINDFTGDWLFNFEKSSKDDSDYVAFSAWHYSGLATDIITDSYVSVPDGLVAGYIAMPEMPFNNGYPEWSKNMIAVPPGTAGNTSEVITLPISVGKDISDTLGLTQEQIWAGAGSYVDTVTPDIDSGATGTGDLAEIISILKNISEYQQTGTIGTQTKIEGLTDVLDITNDLLTDSNSLVSALISANAFGFENVMDTIITVPGAIGDELTGIEDLLRGLTDILGGTTTGVLTDILAGTLSIPKAIADAIAEVLTAAFVPSESFVMGKVDALTDKYKFADSIAKAGKDMDEFLSTLGSKPPVIYIDLSAAEGEYDWGENMVLVDFSFYSKYKDEMDMILSAFLYLWLVWRLILNLPGIISGASGLVGAFNNAAHAGSSGFPAVQNTSASSSAPANTSSISKAERGSLFTPMPGGTTHYEQWRAKQK